MGLLGSILGALTGGGGQQATGGGGLAGVLGMLAQNPQLVQTVAGMLGNDGNQGGLGGLVQKFQQAGLADAIGSWISNGQNQSVDGEQVTQALGSSTVSQIATQLGLDPNTAAGQLAQVLPEVINHLTPQGQAPAGGLGNAGDLARMLGGLLKKA